MLGQVQFDLAGLAHANQRCIYAIVLISTKGVYVYGGVTGTANGTGISSPLQRLGTHLKRRGKTRTFLDNAQNEEVREAIESGGSGFFYYSYCESDEAESQEMQLVSALKAKFKARCLNEAVRDATGPLAPGVSLILEAVRKVTGGTVFGE